MKKTFDDICNEILNEDNVPPVTPQPTVPPSNTPAVYDQQHPAIEALKNANSNDAVLNVLKQFKVQLPPTQTTPSVQTTPQATKPVTTQPPASAPNANPA